jgi:hypothetical protein
MTDIPLATEAFETANRPRKPRSAPGAYHRALGCALAAISRACCAGMVSTFVEVPTFVFGEPRFSIDDVTEYIRSCLESRGYWVTTHSGSPTIAIGWEPVACAPKRAHSDPEGLCDHVRPAKRQRLEPDTAASMGRFDVGI